MIKRIYLDTNVYCRPLDNQKQTRIRREASAFLEVADLAERGEIEVVSSDYVKFEIEQIQAPAKRKDIRGFEKTLSKILVKNHKRTIALSKEFLNECNLDTLDALHLAAACIGKSDFVLTCDDKLTELSTSIEEIALEKGYKLKVRNPVNYIEQRQRSKQQRPAK